MVNNMLQTILNNPWAILIIILWVLPWKAIALWKASRNLHKKWFAALMVLNTLALLEIIYIFFFSKKDSTKTN
jgi:hypothetical protein